MVGELLIGLFCCIPSLAVMCASEITDIEKKEEKISKKKKGKKKGGSK